MKSITLFLLIFCHCLVNCEITKCDNNVTHKYWNWLNWEKFCAEHICFTKCCPLDHIIGYSMKCVPISKFKNPPVEVDYNMIKFYSWDKVVNQIRNTPNKFSNMGWNIVQNQKFNILNTECFNQVAASEKYYLMEDGSLKKDTPNHFYRFTDTKPLDFCVDLRMDPATKKPEVVYRIATNPNDLEKNSNFKYTFIASAMMLSSIFFFVVLVIYTLFLENWTQGRKLMIAISSTLSVAYFLKALMLFGAINHIFEEFTCSLITPMYYYALLASFLWMNVLWYDLFQTSRGVLETDIKGFCLTRFVCFCLYCYGIPFIVTVYVICIDIGDFGPNIVKPFFGKCLSEVIEARLYLQLPIGIIVIINCILLMISGYNIRNFFAERKRTLGTKAGNTSMVFFYQMAFMFGFNWILEFVDVVIDMPTWAFLLVNSYNMFVGVVVFLCFICSKSMILDFLEWLHLKKKPDSGENGVDVMNSFNSFNFPSDVPLLEIQK